MVKVMKKQIFLVNFLFLCLLCGAGSALTVYQNESQLIQTSDLIVYGKIVDVKSGWNAQKTHIETIAQVLVNDTLKNNDNMTSITGNTIFISVLGGTVGNDSEWVEDMPILIKDTEAIFFLKKGSDGKYSVLKISSIINGSINGSIKNPKSPLSENEIAEFKQKITAVLQYNASSTTLPVTAIPTTQKAGMIYAPVLAAIGILILYQNRRKYH
jgi:hypothetical protein